MIKVIGTPNAAPYEYMVINKPELATEIFRAMATLSKIPLNTRAVIVTTKFISVKTIKVVLVFFILFSFQNKVI
jgi:hypothetical protein